MLKHNSPKPCAGAKCGGERGGDGVEGIQTFLQRWIALLHRSWTRATRYTAADLPRAVHAGEVHALFPSSARNPHEESHIIVTGRSRQTGVADSCS